MQRTHDHSIGNMTINGVSIVEAPPSRLIPWTDKSVVKWKPVVKDFSREDKLNLVDIAKSQWLGDIISSAQRKGMELTNDECVDIVDVSISYLNSPTGATTAQYVFTPAIEYYFNFLCSANNLDKPLVVNGATTTLRRSAIEPKDVSDVGKLPFMAKVGTGTTVITSDGYVVLGVRGNTAVAGQSGDKMVVHVLAEGLIAQDCDSSGIIDPKLTSYRGLKEELNIENDKEHKVIDNVESTGFFFDHIRYQPCFAHIAYINVDSKALKTHYKTAMDAWEAKDLIFTKFDINNTELIDLLCGNHPDITLASNHAQAVLYLACLYQFGGKDVEQKLKKKKATLVSLLYPGSCL